MGASVGYSVRVGDGSMTYIGTLLGPLLDSPGYYLDPIERVRSVSDFLARLLASRGVSPQSTGAEGMEIVLRRAPDGYIVAVMNRRGPQELNLEIPGFNEPYVLAKQFSYLGSSAEWDGRLVGKMAGEDILVAHLTRAIQAGG